MSDVLILKIQIKATTGNILETRARPIIISNTISEQLIPSLIHNECCLDEIVD